MRLLSAINEKTDYILAVSIPESEWLESLRRDVSAARKSIVARGYPSPQEWRFVQDAYSDISIYVRQRDNPSADGYDLFPWFPMRGDVRILTYFIRTAEKQYPSGNTLSLKVTPGESAALSFGIRATERLSEITITASDLVRSDGQHIPASALDVRLVKVWYQANDGGIRYTPNKFLLPELLLKDDSLIKVDFSSKMNYLRVTKDGLTEYMDITTPSGVFPADVTVSDASSLKPFDMDAHTFKQIWITVHIPENVLAGEYSVQITVAPLNKPPKIMNLRLTILPFSLAPSLLAYGIYYQGRLTGKSSIDHINKSSEQLALELANLRDHGILYPTSYQPLKTLGEFLDSMEFLGLPEDKLYWLGGTTGNPEEETDLNNLTTKVKDLIAIADRHGFQNPHIYGMDEAKGDILRSERPAWQAVHEAGGKVFVAGSGTAGVFDLVGDLLDTFICSGPNKAEEAQKFHKVGHQIFSYGNPQVGVENPEIYRRNFGIPLLLSGYDGAMDYAYQTAFGGTLPFTISGWFYREGAGMTHTILAKRKSSEQEDSVSSQRGYIVYIDGSTDKLVFEVTAPKRYRKRDCIVTSSTGFNHPGWNHFAVVWDPFNPENIKIYVNGVVDRSVKKGYIPKIRDITNHEPLVIGAQSNGKDPFHGNLSDIRFYKKALTPVAIADIYHNEDLPATDANLVGRWKLDEGKGPLAEDASAGYHEGRLINMDEANWTNGAQEIGLSFNGIDQYVTINVSDGRFDFCGRNIWNDFDDLTYRDHVFAYPTSNGVIDTIQWEGFREGVNDVRYLSTLVKLDKSRTKDQILDWARQILAKNPDLDALREAIISEIQKVIGK